MEPFTMMLGYGLVNSLSQLVVRPIADKLSASGRQQEMKMQMETKHALDLEAVRLNKAIELDNQKSIQDYCHQFRVREAQNQFERQLQMWQIGKFNDQMWPLLTPYDHPSLRPAYFHGRPAPVNVFLAKTDPHSPFAAFVQADLKNRMSNFLLTAYSNDPMQAHPCICRIGDWKDGFQDAAFINALWYGMQGQPSIVVNPIQSEFGEILDLNVSIWGLGESGHSPKTQNVLTGHFGSAIGRIKREETIRWIECGLPVSSPEMTHNANLLKQEERMKTEGHGAYIDNLLIQYKLPKEIQNKVITAFSSEYNHVISCITGMYADIYHLIEYGAQPYMPVAINEYNRATGNTFQIPDVAIQYYRKALTNMTCTDYLQGKLPTAYLGVAKSLSFRPKDSMKIFQESVGLWANKKLDLDKEIPIPTSLDKCLALLYDESKDEDKQYLEKAKEVLISMDMREAANSLNKKISILTDCSTTSSPCQQKEVEWNVVEKVIFTDTDFLKWIKKHCSEAVMHGATDAILSVRTGYFTMMFVNQDAKVVYGESFSGVCVIAERYYLPDELMNNDIIVYNLQNNRFINNKYAFMERKEFDSFERLGKQLDTLVNNLGKLPQAVRARNASQAVNNAVDNNSLEKQLADVFISSNFLSMETENVQTARFDDVKKWINSKLPVQNAEKAHILYTQTGVKRMVCVFFSDNETNTLIGDNYPMKRIICNGCDSDLEAFLNGLAIGTIKL